MLTSELGAPTSTSNTNRRCEPITASWSLSGPLTAESSSLKRHERSGSGGISDAERPRKTSKSKGSLNEEFAEGRSLKNNNEGQHPREQASYDLEKELERVRTNPPPKQKKKLMNPDLVIDSRQRKEDAEALYQWKCQQTQVAETVFRGRITALEKENGELREAMSKTAEKPTDEANVMHLRREHVRFNLELVIGGTKVKDAVVLARECTSLPELLDKAEEVFRGHLQKAGVSMRYNFQYLQLQTTKAHDFKMCGRYQVSVFLRWAQKHVWNISDKYYFNVRMYLAGGDLEVTKGGSKKAKDHVTNAEKDNMDKLFFSSEDEGSDSK